MWLTVALTLATLMLSLVFRRSTFVDPRVGRLRILAWVWISLNLILAVAVYTRLFIYIDYNGMTRMRTVGLLGVTAVVGGFALMRFKILWQREFYWLVQRQLWILGIAVFVYTALPVDSMCHRYNVTRILAGDPAPSVQLVLHPIDSEALPELLPLLDVENVEIRDGVRAILQRRLGDLRPHEERSWTEWQYSRNTATRALEAGVDSILQNQLGAPDTAQDPAEERFRAFAMEWY